MVKVACYILFVALAAAGYGSVLMSLTTDVLPLSLMTWGNFAAAIMAGVFGLFGVAGTACIYR